MKGLNIFTGYPQRIQQGLAHLLVGRIQLGPRHPQLIRRQGNPVKVSGVLNEGLIALALDRMQDFANSSFFVNNLVVVGASTDTL